MIYNIKLSINRLSLVALILLQSCEKSNHIVHGVHKYQELEDITNQFDLFHTLNENNLTIANPGLDEETKDQNKNIFLQPWRYMETVKKNIKDKTSSLLKDEIKIGDYLHYLLEYKMKLIYSAIQQNESDVKKSGFKFHFGDKRLFDLFCKDKSISASKSWNEYFRQIQFGIYELMILLIKGAYELCDSSDLSKKTRDLLRCSVSLHNLLKTKNGDYMDLGTPTDGVGDFSIFERLFTGDCSKPAHNIFKNDFDCLIKKHTEFHSCIILTKLYGRYICGYDYDKKIKVSSDIELVRREVACMRRNLDIELFKRNEIPAVYFETLKAIVPKSSDYSLPYPYFLIEKFKYNPTIYFTDSWKILLNLHEYEKEQQRQKAMEPLQKMGIPICASEIVKLSDIPNKSWIPLYATKIAVLLNEKHRSTSTELWIQSLLNITGIYKTHDISERISNGSLDEIKWACGLIKLSSEIFDWYSKEKKNKKKTKAKNKKNIIEETNKHPQAIDSTEKDNGTSNKPSNYELVGYTEEKKEITTNNTVFEPNVRPEVNNNCNIKNNEYSVVVKPVINFTDPEFRYIGPVIDKVRGPEKISKEEFFRYKMKEYLESVIPTKCFKFSKEALLTKFTIPRIFKKKVQDNINNLFCTGIKFSLTFDMLKPMWECIGGSIESGNGAHVSLKCSDNFRFHTWMPHGYHMDTPKYDPASLSIIRTAFAYMGCVSEEKYESWNKLYENIP